MSLELVLGLALVSCYLALGILFALCDHFDRKKNNLAPLTKKQIARHIFCWGFVVIHENELYWG